MTIATEPHIVALSEGTLKLDHNGSHFQVAFYFRKPGAKTDTRAAHADRSLTVALQKCFKETGSPFAGDSWDKAKLIEGYIRATTWGHKLP